MGDVILFALAILSAGGIAYNFYIAVSEFLWKRLPKTRNQQQADFLLFWPGVLGALVVTGYPYAQLERWFWVPILLDFSSLTLILALLCGLLFSLNDLFDLLRTRLSHPTESKGADKSD